ncbi:MAG: lipopolysaccharide kinase InaA family protein [Parahaliea sp.]
MIARQLYARVRLEGWEIQLEQSHVQLYRHRSHKLHCTLYLTPSPISLLRELIGKRPGPQEQLACEALRAAGLNAPKPLAWGMLEDGVDYLLSETLPGHRLDYWLCGSLTDHDPASLGLRRQLLLAAGTFIGRLHAAGFSHGRLFARNILAYYSGGNFKLSLLNNTDVRQHQYVPGMCLLSDLGQLNSLPASALNNNDRFRFYRAWHQQQNDLNNLEAKILLEQIKRRTTVRQHALYRRNYYESAWPARYSPDKD